MSTCLQEHGIKVPPQVTTGPRPVFDPTGINTKSPKYRRAEKACLPKAVAAYNAALREG